MNIFVTDPCPKKCAEYMDDKRVHCMAKEAAQMLFIVERLANGETKIGHKNHPCSVWCRETRDNYNWLVKHLKCLASEFSYRKQTTPCLDQFDSLEGVEEFCDNFGFFQYDCGIHTLQTLNKEHAGEHIARLSNNAHLVPEGPLTPFPVSNDWKDESIPFGVHTRYQYTMMHKWYITDVRKPVTFKRRGLPPFVPTGN